jgi:hypothetical protein
MAISATPAARATVRRREDNLVIVFPFDYMSLAFAAPKLWSARFSSQSTSGEAQLCSGVENKARFLRRKNNDFWYC